MRLRLFPCLSVAAQHTLFRHRDTRVLDALVRVGLSPGYGGVVAPKNCHAGCGLLDRTASLACGLCGRGARGL